MKRIKTDWGNKLSPCSLSQLIMIKLDGPGMNQFNLNQLSREGGEKVQGLVNLVAWVSFSHPTVLTTIMTVTDLEFYEMTYDLQDLHIITYVTKLVLIIVII